MDLTTDSKIIVGSGNPGKKYEETRHNVGFEFIDYLTEKAEIPLTIDKRKATYGVSKYGDVDNKWILLKPQTFMSILGESILYLAAFFKIKSRNIFLIYDDVDIEYGKFIFEKVDKDKPNTKHSAIKNTLEILNSDDFHVIGIGIGPLPKRKRLEDYYLEKFSDEERKKVTSTFLPIYRDLKKFINNS